MRSSCSRLDHYFRVFEGVTPDFVARLWLGDRWRRAKVRSTVEPPTASRPTSRWQYLTQTPGVQNLTIDKQGAGRLYYRVGMRYAPTDSQPQAR